MHTKLHNTDPDENNDKPPQHDQSSSGNLQLPKYEPASETDPTAKIDGNSPAKSEPDQSFNTSSPLDDQGKANSKQNCPEDAGIECRIRLRDPKRFNQRCWKYDQ